MAISYTTSMDVAFCSRVQYGSELPVRIVAPHPQRVFDPPQRPSREAGRYGFWLRERERHRLSGKVERNRAVEHSGASWAVGRERRRLPIGRRLAVPEATHHAGLVQLHQGQRGVSCM